MALNSTLYAVASSDPFKDPRLQYIPTYEEGTCYIDLVQRVSKIYKDRRTDGPKVGLNKLGIHLAQSH